MNQVQPADTSYRTKHSVVLETQLLSSRSVRACMHACVRVRVCV